MKLDEWKTTFTVYSNLLSGNGLSLIPAWYSVNMIGFSNLDLYDKSIDSLFWFYAYRDTVADNVCDTTTICDVRVSNDIFSIRTSRYAVVPRLLKYARIKLV